MDGLKVGHVFFFVLLLFAFNAASCFTLNSENSSSSQTEQSQEEEEKSQSVKNQFYLGAKVGLVFILGIEANYILQTNNVNRLYLATAIQSSFIINSVNAGGGFFLGRTGIGIGCRYHHLLWFESEKESKIQPGYGPELVYNKTIGTKYIVNLHVGGIITEGSFFPDISFGIFLPLN